MGLLRWFTENRANTTEPTHADLAPLRLPGTMAQIEARVRGACGRLRGWAVESAEPGAMHLVRRTRVLGFADDIRLTLVTDGAGVRIDAESRSRVGKGDLGQNRRNILELFAALKATADPT